MSRRFKQYISTFLLSFILMTLIVPFYVYAETGTDPYVAPDDLYIPVEDLYVPDQNIYKPSIPYQAPTINGNNSGENSHQYDWKERLKSIFNSYDNKSLPPDYVGEIRSAITSAGFKYYYSHLKYGHRLMPRYDSSGKLIGYIFTGQLDTFDQKIMSGLGKTKLFGQTVPVTSLPIKNQFNDFKSAFKFKMGKLGNYKFSGWGTWGLSALGGAITASLEGHEKWDDWAASFTVETVVGAATTAAGSAIGSALAGALASTAAGAALGSSVPIVGTIIGAVAGIGLYALTNTSWGLKAKNWLKSGVKSALGLIPDSWSKNLQSAYESAKSTVSGWLDKGKSAISSVKNKISSLFG
jgi:hypothetical protein